MLVEKTILTATEAAAMLGISTQTVYAALEAKELIGYKENEYTAWKIRDESVKRYACLREEKALERMRKNQFRQDKNEDISREKDENPSKKDDDSPKKPQTSK